MRFAVFVKMRLMEFVEHVMNLVINVRSCLENARIYFICIVLSDGRKRCNLNLFVLYAKESGVSVLKNFGKSSKIQSFVADPFHLPFFNNTEEITAEDKATTKSEQTNEREQMGDMTTDMQENVPTNNIEGSLSMESEQ